MKVVDSLQLLIQRFLPISFLPIVDGDEALYLLNAWPNRLTNAEVIRSNDQVICYLPNVKTVLVEERNRLTRTGYVGAVTWQALEREVRIPA